jgi:hypothetical protein
MQRRVLLSATAALVVMLALASATTRVSGAAAAALGSGSGTQTFTDPTGDVINPSGSGGADIASVTVSDVAASGLITVAVTVTTTDASTGVFAFLDTDQNASTGSSTGAEYALFWGQDSGQWGWDIEHWNGSDWVTVTQTATMSFARSGAVLTWTINKTDIGSPSAFNLNLGAMTMDASGNPTGVDLAPDSGVWSYTLSTVPPPPPPVVVVKPLIGRPTLTPARAVAGKRVTVAFPVTRSDTGAALTAGKMVCDPSVAGKVIPHAEQFKGGIARLSFVIPKSAKGKLLKVHLTIKSGAQSATTTASFRVK